VWHVDKYKTCRSDL